MLGRGAQARRMFGCMTRLRFGGSVSSVPTRSIQTFSCIQTLRTIPVSTQTIAPAPTPPGCRLLLCTLQLRHRRLCLATISPIPTTWPDCLSFDPLCKPDGDGEEEREEEKSRHNDAPSSTSHPCRDGERRHRAAAAGTVAMPWGDAVDELARARADGD